MPASRQLFQIVVTLACLTHPEQTVRAPISATQRMEKRTHWSHRDRSNRYRSHRDRLLLAQRFSAGGPAHKLTASRLVAMNHSTTTGSSSNLLSSSVRPASANELVTSVLPFNTLVITYEHPIQCASARSVCDQRGG